MIKLIKTMMIFLMTFTSLNSFAECDVGQVDLVRGEVADPLGATVADPVTEKPASTELEQ